MIVAILLLVAIGASTATHSKGEKTCNELPESGICMAYFEKYYYDSESETCKKFIYGGCQGNGNRYDSEEECLQNCAGKSNSDVDLCSLEAETGPCRAYIPSYFYNSKTGKCEEFIYGGCGGNDNRFHSEGSCYDKCGNEVDLCSLEAETGPCRARSIQYYFNSKTGKCETFTYGGCRGNDNRFKTEESCYARCGQQKAEVNLCELEAEPGHCKAYIPRYFFNSKTQKCEKFIYGGCGGNDNRFKTIDECSNKCADVCTLEPETGMCRGNFPMFYFDSSSNECKEFVYGGCQGNGNRFSTKEECYNKCSAIWQAEDGCSLDADSGPCKGFFPRYYFNKEKGICETFVYGGCGGNSNNHETYEECASVCGAP